MYGKFKYPICKSSTIFDCVSEKTNIDSSTVDRYLTKLVSNGILVPEYKELVSDAVKSSSSLTYSRVEINNKSIPIIILLAYELGLLNVLERYGIKYEFTETNKRISVTDDLNKIKFQDGYLVYDSSLMRNDILLSGLLVLDTENIAFSDLNSQEPYIDWFYDKFNSRNVGKGIHNTLTLLIDPITKEILHDLKQPENVYDVLLYANTLLEDLSFYNYNDMHIYWTDEEPSNQDVIDAMLEEAENFYETELENQEELYEEDF